MNKEEKGFYSIGRGSLNLNGKFYYGLDYAITDFMINLEQQNQKYKEVIDKAINNSQYWIDYYTRLNSDERIALRLQENIDILKEVE